MVRPDVFDRALGAVTEVDEIVAEANRESAVEYIVEWFEETVHAQT